LDLHMPPAKRLPPKRPAKRAAIKRAAPLVDALAQAAWTEADASLAEALVECDRAIEARSDDAREEALSLLQLALGRAARRRGLARIGKPGAVEDFDPMRHDLFAAGKRAPKRVRIAEPGVMRGGELLIRARVKPARIKRK
jgi:hypothetical protein